VAAAAAIPFDQFNPNLRERVRKVVASPTLVTHADSEEFEGSVAMYNWLMDHPDRATLAWQRMGVTCSPITDRGRGFFGWADDNGSDVVWSTIHSSPTARVWYAEGTVKAGKIGPRVPVKGVVVMRHTLPATGEGTIRHEIDLFCYADHRAAQIAYRMMGNKVDRHAEEAAGQLMMFFSALTRQMKQHPEQTEQLLAPPAPAVRAASK